MLLKIFKSTKIFKVVLSLASEALDDSQRHDKSTSGVPSHARAAAKEKGC